MPPSSTAAPISIERPLEVGTWLRERQRDSESYMGILFTISRHHKGDVLDDRSAGRLKKALDFFAGEGAIARAIWIDPVVETLRARGDAGLHTTIERFVAQHTALCDRHEEVESLGRRWLRDGRLDGDGADALAELLAEIQQGYASTVDDREQVLLPAFEDACAAREAEIGIDPAVRRPAGTGQ